MTTQLFTRAGAFALAAGALITLSPKQSHAEQFTLFDVTFNFTWEDAINAKPSQSHYYVKSDKLNPQRPTNWMAPIDYRGGIVHIHLEVLEKPAGGQMQGWALCYVGGGSYGCPYSKYYTDVGTYENEVDMTKFYNNDTIDWTKGITEVDLVYTINNSGSGHVHFFPELKDKTTPTKVRIAMVQVAKGSTYDSSMLPGGMGMGGAGAGGASGVSGSAGLGGAGGGGAGGVASGGMPTGGGGTGSGEPTSPGGAAGTGTVLPMGGMPSTGTGGALPSAGTGATLGPALTDTGQDGGCALGGRRSHPASPSVGWLSLAALGLLWRSRRRA
jgi:hypothetical protein